jgi:hypothetical protein
MAWRDWLMLVADQLAADFPGETGLFLASVVGALGYQAHELGATSPSEHERLAQEAAEREAAWVQALEAEAMQPGGAWEPTDASIGPLDGHDDAAQQYWIGSDPDDLTYRN